MNRNKRSVTLDLKSAGKTAVLLQAGQGPPTSCRELPPRRAEAPGLGYEVLKEDQPAAGLHQHLGLRPDRPLGRPAGLRPDGAGHVGRDERDRLPGQPAGEGRRAGGRHRLRAVRHLRTLAAYIGAKTVGQGQHVDAALFDSAMAFSVWDTCDWWGTGKPPTAAGHRPTR
jgi:hypothetical protein